jgi:hypothetical protein
MAPSKSWQANASEEVASIDKLFVGSSIKRTCGFSTLTPANANLNSKKCYLNTQSSEMDYRT